MLWTGIPAYLRLRTSAGAATLTEFALGLAAAVLMQMTYWPAYALQQHLRFRRNVVLGHVLVVIGEVSLFFTAALATVVAFDRFGEGEWVPWKLLILAAILFAASCYKRQLKALGESLIESPPDVEGSRRAA